MCDWRLLNEATATSHQVFVHQVFYNQYPFDGRYAKSMIFKVGSEIMRDEGQATGELRKPAAEGMIQQGSRKVGEMIEIALLIRENVVSKGE
jgi:hypothetical protein